MSPSLDATLGIWLVSYFVGSMCGSLLSFTSPSLTPRLTVALGRLYGCSLLQIWLYSHWYPLDHWILKAMVSRQGFFEGCRNITLDFNPTGHSSWVSCSLPRKLQRYSTPITLQYFGDFADYFLLCLEILHVWLALWGLQRPLCRELVSVPIGPFRISIVNIFVGWTR